MDVFGFGLANLAFQGCHQGAGLAADEGTTALVYGYVEIEAGA
ncbi:hypothetical protein ES703_33951 [subsurface metagenome]